MKDNIFSLARNGKKDRPEIIEVRHLFFNKVVFPFLILGLFSVGMGSYQAYEQGRWFFSILYIGSYLLFLVASLLGNRISLFLRALCLILALFVTALLVLLRIGLSGIGVELLILMSAISSVLLGKRAGLELVGLGFLTMLIVGGAMVSGLLPINEKHMLNSLSPLAWGTSIVVFLMVGIALVALPQMFLKRLTESLDQLEEHSKMLEQSNASLKETIQSRDEAEKALRESEAKYRLLVDNAGEAVFVAVDGRITYANPRTTEISGYSIEEITSGPFIEFIHPEDRPCVLERHNQRLAGTDSPSSYEFRVVHRSGEILWVSLNVVRIEWEGQPATLNFLGDISEAKKAEELNARLESQLRQSQKMEAVGTLAGGIAHDFNNLLGAIMGYGELAQLAFLKGRPNNGHIDQIVKAAERGRDLVKQLLTFSRKSETRLEPVNFNELVTHSVRMLEHTMPKMIDIRLRLSENLGWTMADATQMEQVILNLANNAGDAMPEGGRLVFETSPILLDREFAATHPEMTPGEYVLLTVTDTGQGMDRQTLYQIFDPFFTTKEIGKGTGLGLSTVYGIVKEHGGHISCDSEPGLGTTFKIYLPVTDFDPDSSRIPNSHRTIAPGGRETILLVDDEESIREVAAEILEEVGYRVITEASGEEALTWFETAEEKPDLVILDLGMPGMGGHRCLKALLALNPGLSVLIASGYSSEGKVRDTLEQGAAGFIAKPFRRIDLLQTIRTVLDAQG